MEITPEILHRFLYGKNVRRTMCRDLTYTGIRCPAWVRIGPSTVPGRDVGVFVTETLARGVRVGPYPGPRVPPSHLTSGSPELMWEVFFPDGSLSHYIDGSRDSGHSCGSRGDGNIGGSRGDGNIGGSRGDGNIGGSRGDWNIGGSRSKWMTLINTARSAPEQNLEVLQIGMDIYYRTIQDIPAGSELLVWYGETYDLYFGIPNHVKITRQGQDRISGLSKLRSQVEGDEEQRERGGMGERERRGGPGRIGGLGDREGRGWPGRGGVREREGRDGPGGSVVDRHGGGEGRGGPWGGMDEGGVGRGGIVPEVGELGRDGIQGYTRVGQGLKDGEFGVKMLRNFIGTEAFEGLKFSGGDMVARGLKIFDEEGRGLKLQGSTGVEGLRIRCTVCSKMFNSRSNLRSHMRTHTLEKPFCCQFCQRRFSQSSTLRNHVRLHTGERPYRCEACSRSYSQLAGLRAHQKSARHRHPTSGPHTPTSGHRHPTSGPHTPTSGHRLPTSGSHTPLSTSGSTGKPTPLHPNLPTLSAGIPTLAGNTKNIVSPGRL